ncbi:MAG: aminotransferase class IV [Gemmatimonadota bacterium]
MIKGTHDFLEDPRNENVLVYVNGDLVPRNEAKVSVFDAGFCLGDGVWEGIRLHNGRFAFLEAHLDRLFQGAKAIALDITKSRKKTPSQDPRYNEGGPTIVIIAEHKRVDRAARESGIELYTCHVRRSRPDVQDPKINSHSKLNCILAMIQAIAAGADEALMLDPDGFVSTCNATNFFIVRRGEVWTSTGQYCLNGITRAQVIDICRAHEIPVFEKEFTLLEVYDADESFVTGTFGGLTPVHSVDGRTIGSGELGDMTRRLMDLYRARVEGDPRR